MAINSVNYGASILSQSVRDLNSQLTTLLNNEASAETISALPSIGRTIEYQSNQGALQNGSVTFSYTVPSAAAKATINVTAKTRIKILHQPALSEMVCITLLW